MSVIISADNANGASICTNMNYIHTETICMSNGLILNSLELDPQRDHLYPISKNSVH